MRDFLIFGVVAFLLLMSCNRRWAKKVEFDDSEYYKNCYHENFIVDEDVISKGRELFSKRIPNYDTILINSDLELFYEEHCFECSDRDRYAIFTFIDRKRVMTAIKVLRSGEVYYCNSFPLNIENFYSNIAFIENKLVSRDCSDLDVVNTSFYIRDLNENKIISYFESIGLEGNILDNINSYYRQVLIIREILRFSCLEQ